LPFFLVGVPLILLIIYLCCFRKTSGVETDALREAESKRLEAEEIARVKSEMMFSIKLRAEATAKRL